MTTLEKPVVRKTKKNFMHYRHPLIVTLQREDLLAIREYRCRRVVYIDLHSAYIDGLRRQVLAEKRERRKKRGRR
jgi:hypothetical protein